MCYNLKDVNPETRDPLGPIGAALQKRMRVLWQRSLARLLLQVLARGEAEADSRGLGSSREVCWPPVTFDSTIKLDFC